MRRINWLAVGIAVVALVAAGWAIYEPYMVRQDAAAVQSQAKSLADQVAEACAKGGAAAAELGPAGTCAKAAEVKDQAPVADQASSPAPDPAALRQAARSAVAEYCASRDQCRGPDGVTPNFDALTDAVLARIPIPKDGHDGADAPVPDYPALVAAYCGQDTDPCRGPAGAEGAPGATGATGAAGAPGPTCPDGYDLRDAVITAPDQTTYQGKACVDPSSGIPPSQPEPPTGG